MSSVNFGSIALGTHSASTPYVTADLGTWVERELLAAKAHSAAEWSRTPAVRIAVVICNMQQEGEGATKAIGEERSIGAEGGIRAIGRAQPSLWRRLSCYAHGRQRSQRKPTRMLGNLSHPESIRICYSTAAIYHNSMAVLS